MPLNPLLYRRLEKVFHHVAIGNQGERRLVRYLPDQARAGRLKAYDHISGEYYRVSCPFCTDTRQRLWINHMFGVYDPKTRSENLHLAICFNEDCLSDFKLREKLHLMLDPLVLRKTRKTDIETAAAAASSKPSGPITFELPENVQPIHELPSSHPAVQYLSARGFDTDDLWANWQVYYSPNSDEPPPRFSDRIVIPVYKYRPKIFDGKDELRLAGWQARLVSPSPNTEAPKYLSAAGMKKSELLYDLPRAAHTTGPIVIVEGAIDVWRLGSNAVALFGKSLSRQQLALVLRFFAGRPAVVFLDQDAQEEAELICSSVQNARNCAMDDAEVVIAELPRRRGDVGECTRREAWVQLAKALGQPIECMPVSPLD
jgi:hypothetical protein